jgi:hypothetical protein
MRAKRDFTAFSDKFELVMAGLVPAIHALQRRKDVDARPKACMTGAIAFQIKRKTL